MYYISLLIAIVIFIVGLLINASMLHSQNKSYLSIIRKHVNRWEYEPIIDGLWVFMTIFLMMIPVVNVMTSITFNILLFMRGLQEE